MSSRDDRRRFTGRQVTTIVVAIALTIIAFPVGVFAATGSLVNITDPVSPSHKARVTAHGQLLVGDGAGALTVNGTVGSRPVPPGTPWRITAEPIGPNDIVLGPTARTINITSLSVSAPTST